MKFSSKALKFWNSIFMDIIWQTQTEYRHKHMQINFRIINVQIKNLITRCTRTRTREYFIFVGIICFVHSRLVTLYIIIAMNNMLPKLHRKLSCNDYGSYGIIKKIRTKNYCIHLGKYLSTPL